MLLLYSIHCSPNYNDSETGIKLAPVMHQTDAYALLNYCTFFYVFPISRICILFYIELTNFHCTFLNSECHSYYAIWRAIDIPYTLGWAFPCAYCCPPCWLIQFVLPSKGSAGREWQQLWAHTWLIKVLSLYKTVSHWPVERLHVPSIKYNDT